MSHARWWDFAAPLMAGAREVFAVDPFGHGDSDWLDSADYGFGRQVGETRAVANGIGGGAWVVAGHSRGGLVAALLAARWEAWVQAVVLVEVPIEPASRRLVRVGRLFRAMTQPSFATLEEAIRSFRVFPDGHTARPEVIAYLAHESMRARPEGGYTTKFDWRSFGRETPRCESLVDFRSTLRRIRCPVLCVRGAGSPILTAAQLGEMAELIPRGETVEIVNATHHPHVENPEAVAGEITRFLEHNGL